MSINMNRSNVTTEGILKGTIGIGQYIVNDYVLTLEPLETGDGYTLTIRKGSDVQTVTLEGLSEENLEIFRGYVAAAQAAQLAAEGAQNAAETAQGNAEDAQAAAEAAQSLAETAQAAAETAETNAGASATQAGTSASSAAQSAAQAAGSAAAAAQTLTDVQAAGQAQIAAIGAEGERVLETIPEDYSELSGDVSSLKTSIDGESVTINATSVIRLNHKDSTTVYETGSDYRTYYIAVESGKTYTFTCTQKTGQTSTTNVRLCFGTEIPANGVSAEYLYKVGINSSSLTFSYTASNNGYLGMASYYSGGEGIESIVAQYSSVGLEGRVEAVEGTISNDFVGDVNDIILWQEGYYGASEGAYTPKNEINPLCCTINGISDLVDSVDAPDDYVFRLHGWNGSGVYVGTWTGTAFATVYSSQVTWFSSLDIAAIREDYSGYTLKLCVKNATSATTDVPLSDMSKMVMVAPRIKYALQQVYDAGADINSIGLRVAAIENLNATSTDYVIDANMLRRPIKVTEIGSISGYQSFCERYGKYYSTGGSSVVVQSSDFTVEQTVSLSLGHGNAFMRGHGNKAYVSGWDDDKVYAVDLSTLTIDTTYTLPVSGYTTVAVDDVNEIMYIFWRITPTGSVENYRFTAWDYRHDEVLFTKLTTNEFAAMQACDFVNGKIIIAWGLGTQVAPSGMAVYDTNGNILAEYKLAILNSNEPEGVCYDRSNNRLLFSTVNQKVYKIEAVI